MAHKKGLGSSRNGRDSNPKMLGVKVFAGQQVSGGEIIVRQRGTRFYPGPGAGIGRDWALISISPQYQSLVSPTMPVWGGPIGTFTSQGEVASVSLYDGAHALAEAAMLALNATGKQEIIVSAGVHPHHRAVLRSRLTDLPAVRYTEIPLKDGVVDTQELEDELEEDTAALEAEGAAAADEKNRVQRFWRDANAAALHASIDWDTLSALYGTQQLGLQPQGIF